MLSVIREKLSAAVGTHAQKIKLAWSTDQVGVDGRRVGIFGDQRSPDMINDLNDETFLGFFLRRQKEVNSITRPTLLLLFISSN